jgi:hypothetical protein
VADIALAGRSLAPGIQKKGGEREREKRGYYYYGPARERERGREYRAQHKG